MAEMYQALANIEHERKQVLMMGELFDRYLVEVVPEKAPATQRSNQNSLQFLRTFFGEMRVHEVEAQHVFQYRDIRSKAGRTAANRDLETLSHCFTKAIEWGLIGNDKHPTRGLRIKISNPPRDRYVTDVELAAFLSVCGSFLGAYVGLKRLTGLSKGDLLSLRLSEIREDGIHYTRRKTTGRGAKPKIIARTPELNAALAECMNVRGKVEGMTLFCTRDGQPYIKEDGTTSGFDSIWSRAMAKTVSAGIERFTEHDLRAKAASETSLQHAQELLDHTSPGMTQRVYRRAPVTVMPLPGPAK